jgi:hypothetical protein
MDNQDGSGGDSDVTFGSEDEEWNKEQRKIKAAKGGAKRTHKEAMGDAEEYAFERDD